MLRICMLLPFPYFRYESPGSPQWRLDPQMEITAYLAQLGHQVHCVAVLDKATQVEPLLFGACVHTIQPYRTGYLPLRLFYRLINTWRKTRFAYRVIKRKKCNLLFVRSEDALDCLTGVILRKRSKLPFVYELVNPLHMSWEICRLENRRPRFLHYLACKASRMLRVYAMKHADLVLPTTCGFIDEIINAGISGSKLMPYPNGVNVKVFRTATNSLIKYTGSSRTIIYVGSLSKSRNLTMLVQAVAKVKVVEQDIKLMLVGDGSDTADLKRLAFTLGVGENVMFTGHLPSSQIPDIVAKAAIAVSPIPPYSFYVVSSPVKLFEYMALAKPVVANDEIQEQKEVLKESGGGFAVPFTADAFASAFIRLLNDPEQASQMGERGYCWVKANRTYDVMARRIERKYIELVQNSKADIPTAVNTPPVLGINNQGKPYAK